MDGMSPAHASTRRETKSENKNSFPHKAQDKINPIHILKAKMSVFLALLLMLLENMVTQSTLSMTENSTVVQNKLLILTFILIQFAE